MAEPSIIINAHFQATAGREAELRNQLRAMVAPSRQEPGCLEYVLHVDPQHAGRLMFYEKFASQAAVDAHLTTPHFLALSQYLKENEGLIASQTVTHWRILG